MNFVCLLQICFVFKQIIGIDEYEFCLFTANPFFFSLQMGLYVISFSWKTKFDELKLSIQRSI